MKKYKGQQLSLMICSCVSWIAYSGGAPVHDGMSYVQLLKIFNNNQEQLLTIEDASSDIKKLNSILGSNANNQVLHRLGKKVTAAILQNSFFSKDNTLALETVFNKDVNWEQLSHSKEAVDTTLFPAKKSSGSVAYLEIDRVQHNRKKILKNSTSASLALSQTKQSSISNTQQSVANIANSAATSKTVHEDLYNANQALIIIASEMVQMRQILAKQLELTSMLTIHLTGDFVGMTPLASKLKNASNMQSSKFLKKKLAQKNFFRQKDSNYHSWWEK